MSTAGPVDVPHEALSLIRTAVTTAQRNSGVQFDRGFARSSDPEGEPSPLSNLLRGGDVALRLLLLVTLQATKAPYEVTAWTSAKYVRALDLPRENDKGARRIRDALRLLVELKLVSVEKRSNGQTPKLTIFRADGSGDTTRRANNYIGVPKELWEQGWILRLSIPAIVVYIDLLDALFQASSPTHIPTVKKRSYGVSDDTWLRGTRELETHRLITIGSEWVDGDFEKNRRRNTYAIIAGALNRPAYPVGTP